MKDTFTVKGLVVDVDYTITHTDDGFELKLIKDISQPFTITYSTEPTDLITVKSMTIKNTVTRGDRGNDPKSKGMTYEQNVLSKPNAQPNYKNKTADWTIVLNSAKYTMDSIELTDTFEHRNMEIVPGTFKVNNIDEKDLQSEGYTFTNKGKNGFTLTRSDTIGEPIKITYTTSYDVKDIDETGNLDNYINKANLSWDNGRYFADVEAKIEINPQQKNKGYKIGKYNYKTKRFQWSVGINYNFSTYTDAIFKDTLSESQKVLRETIKVYELDLSAGGNGTIDENNPLTKGTDYTLEPVGSENEFTIKFNGEIKEAYRIVYESQNKDAYYEPSNGKYKVKNNATLNTGTNGKWDKEVDVEHSDKLITKGYQQDGTSAKLKWSLRLNWGQSELDNVVIKDTIGKDGEGNPNQKIYEESFKIYQMDFSSDNSEPRKRLDGHSPGTGLYDVTFNEPDSTFKITFHQPINEAYTVEYDTYFLGQSGDTLENTAKLSYTSNISNNHEPDVGTISKSFFFDGGASAVKGGLEITKVDEDDETKKLSGAEFELWSDKIGGILIERVSEDIDGVYRFKTKVGQTNYWLKETKAPKGYLLPSNGREVIIKDKGNTSTPDYVERITIGNTKLGQRVILTKKDAEHSNKPLPGAEFELYEGDNLVLKDSFENTIQQPFTTDEFGMIKVENLSPGTYYFKEIKAPDNYLLPTDEAERKTKPFTITDKAIDDLTMYNTRGTGKIIVEKQDWETNAPLEGVEFSISKENDEPFSGGATSLSATTNAAGLAEFNNLPYGTYILKETKTLNKYVLDSSPMTVALNSDEGEKDATITVEVKNIKKDYSVQLTKHNAEEDSKLSNAIFELRKEVDGKYEVVVMDQAELTTDKNGIIALKKLEVGKYQLVEKTAPNGYVLDQTPIEFEIENNQIVPKVVKMINTRITGNIQFDKHDEKNDPLPGAEFSLYHVDNDLAPIKTAISDEAGRVIFEDILSGDYKIRETNAPEGYVLSEEVLTATISEDDKTVTAAPASISNTKIRGNFELKKTNLSGSVLLPNAKIAVYTVDGTFVDEKVTNSVGIAKFEDLVYGNYYYQETKAPVGYILDKHKYYFKIKEAGKTVESTLTNRPDDDDYNPNPGGGGGDQKTLKIQRSR